MHFVCDSTQACLRVHFQILKSEGTEDGLFCNTIDIYSLESEQHLNS